VSTERITPLISASTYITPPPTELTWELIGGRGQASIEVFPMGAICRRGLILPKEQGCIWLKSFKRAVV